jgi:hypothetical protein
MALLCALMIIRATRPHAIAHVRGLPSLTSGYYTHSRLGVSGHSIPSLKWAPPFDTSSSTQRPLQNESGR